MKKILNKRLQMISAFIDNNTCVCDIGCDHGLLGIYLVLNKQNIKMISSDINEKPLLKAKENMEKYGVLDKVTLKLGNGLDVLETDVDTIVISGMGGITITKILEKINDYPNVRKMILSPNNDFLLVRKMVTKHGFKIVNEKIVWEKDKYYLVCVLEKGQDKCNYFFGKLDLSDNVVKDYYENIYKTNQKIIKKLSIINRLKKLNLWYENYLIRKKYKKLK